MRKGSLEFALTETTCIIILTGEISWELSCDLSSFIDCVLNEKVVKEIVFDLSKTTYMDSTSLGVLAHCKLKAAESGVPVSIVNPTGEMVTSLQNIGLDKIFEIKYTTIPNTSPPHTIPATTNCTPHEVAALVRKTHLALININDSNRAKFSGVIDAIDHSEPPEEQ